MVLSSWLDVHLDCHNGSLSLYQAWVCNIDDSFLSLFGFKNFFSFFYCCILIAVSEWPRVDSCLEITLNLPGSFRSKFVELSVKVTTNDSSISLVS